MRKALNFIFLLLVFFLAFQAFACKSVQKTVKEEPGEAAETMSQTNTMETGTGTVKAKAKAGSTETGKKKTGSTGTSKKKVSSTETGKKKVSSNETAKAGSNETDKSKQGKLVELKEEVITEAEKIINPSIRKAILPSGVGLLILISLMSSKKDRKRR